MGMNVAVIEAGISSLQKRLLEQSLRFYVSIHKLDSSHIHTKLAKSKHKRRFTTPLRKAAVMVKTIEASRAEKIPAVGCEPWGPKAHVYILDWEQAKLATVAEPGTIDFYTDGSRGTKKLGLGSGHLNGRRQKRSKGWKKRTFTALSWKPYGQWSKAYHKIPT